MFYKYKNILNFINNLRNVNRSRLFVIWKIGNDYKLKIIDFFKVVGK